MSWESESRELAERRRLAKTQGGAEGIAKQHAKGRLSIRERIDAVLDADSFVEQGQATAVPEYDDKGQLLGYVPANYVLGHGRVDERLVGDRWRRLYAQGRLAQRRRSAQERVRRTHGAALSGAGDSLVGRRRWQRCRGREEGRHRR